MQIGARSIGGGAPLFVIAEIGLNHDGDAARALALVDAAARAGASAVKLQSLRAETLVAPERVSAGATLAHVDGAVAARRLRALRARRGRAPRRGGAGAPARPGLALEPVRRSGRRHARAPRLRRAEDRQRRHHPSPADRAGGGHGQAAGHLDRPLDPRRSRGRGRLRPRRRGATAWRCCTACRRIRRPTISRTSPPSARWPRSSACRSACPITRPRPPASPPPSPWAPASTNGTSRRRTPIR